jgi:hypothetical protein
MQSSKRVMVVVLGRRLSRAFRFLVALAPEGWSDLTTYPQPTLSLAPLCPLPLTAARIFFGGT